MGLLNSPSTSYVVWNPGVQTNDSISDTYPPTVPEHPGQSRTQEAIYLESPGKSGHPLPRPSHVLVP